MQSQLPAYHPMDALSDDTPVTVGMLRASMDQLGQGVGFALSGALFEAGMEPDKCKGIALALHALVAQGVFAGPAFDVLCGIAYGIDMHLHGTPDGVGKQT